MADVFFFAMLTLVVLGSAAWLLFDFGELWRGQAPSSPERFTSLEHVPSWMRKATSACAPNDLPPTVGPARLPSFAWRRTAGPTCDPPSPRRTRRPRRRRPSALRHAV